MQIEERQVGEIMILDLKGKITLGEGDEVLKDKINSLILQNKKRILLNLAEAARQNGITTLTAYTLPNNRGMIKLFKKLPYQTETTFEDNTVVLTCNFGEPDQGAMGHV